MWLFVLHLFWSLRLVDTTAFSSVAKKDTSESPFLEAPTRRLKVALHQNVPDTEVWGIGEAASNWWRNVDAIGTTSDDADARLEFDLYLYLILLSTFHFGLPQVAAQSY